MDDSRKRYVTAGIIVGAVAVGLTVLAKRTPRDQWAATLSRVAKDALSVVKARYGSNEPIRIVEKTLENIEGTELEESPIAKAFAEAVRHEPHRI